MKEILLSFNLATYAQAGIGITTPANQLDANVWVETSLHPNPVKEYLFIDSKLEISKAELYDILGKKVLSNFVLRNKLNVSELNSGVYILKLFYATNGISIKRIIIE